MNDMGREISGDNTELSIVKFRINNLRRWIPDTDENFISQDLGLFVQQMEWGKKTLNRIRDHF